MASRLIHKAGKLSLAPRFEASGGSLSLAAGSGFQFCMVAKLQWPVFHLRAGLDSWCSTCLIQDP